MNYDRRILKYTEPILDMVYGAGNKNLKPQKIEVENKYRIKNLEKFKKILERQGFSLNSEIIQRDKYLNNDDLKKKGELIRIRKVYNNQGAFREGELKWEGLKGVILDRPVVEVRVLSDKDVSIAEKLLRDRLRVEELVEFKKYRFLYTKKNAQNKLEIELDLFEKKSNPKEIRGKTYVQIALEVSARNREKAIRVVKKEAQRLGLVEEDNRDYLEIIKIK